MAMQTVLERREPTIARPVAQRGYAVRALALWPRLDAARLRRAKGDPIRIARLVQERTMLSFEDILALLGVAPAD